MDLSDLLQLAGYAPERREEMLLLRHRPYEPKLARAMPWIISERPDLFDAYQRIPGERVAGMHKAKYVVSCLGMAPGKAHFVGLYRIGAATPLTREQFWEDPANRELNALGYTGFHEEEERRYPVVHRFDLTPEPFHPDWRGRLILGFPPPERSWFRWLDRNRFPVLAIREDSAFAAAPPGWEEMNLGWAELQVLPAAWAAKLAEWRGIYLIFDEADGMRYVGAAYGRENLLGRWRAYGKTGHGGNRDLKGRDPSGFRFTILERLSPDLAAEEVIAREDSWKRRLHTRAPHGLNAN